MAEYSHAIAPRQVGGLAALTGQPRRYTQRSVEHLSFVPTGGQRWVRTLQIQIPVTERSQASSWWVVSLGQFERKRLADLFVTDAHGDRLDLLTRYQHGDVLTGVITAKYLQSLSRRQQTRLKRGSAQRLNRHLRELLFHYFISLDIPKSKKWQHRLTRPLAAKYAELLNELALSEPRRRELITEFTHEFEELEKTTQYLCWVKAYPGEVISLRASYTANDPKHELRLATVGKAATALFQGIFHPEKGRKVRDDWYRQYGLAPIGYRSGFPRGAGAGSYYLTLEPPADTVCTFLDWESGSSFDEMQEVNSAFPALHIHNNSSIAEKEAHTERPAGELRTYLRCAPYRHKQILGAAALNFAVIWLLARRELPFGLSGVLQELILAAPSVLVAFIAQRQSHYHAHVTRRQRAILWGYLTVSVAFLVNIAFADHHGGSPTLNLWTDVFAWAVAISSAGLFGWHLLLGSSYERAVHYLTDRKWEVKHPAAPKYPKKNLPWQRRLGNWVRRWYWKKKNIEADAKWECFAFAVRQYAVVMWVLAGVLMICAVLALETFGHFPLKLAQPTQNGTTDVRLDSLLLHPHQHIQPQLVVTRKAEGR